MAYDEDLAQRIRTLISTIGDGFTEKKMFGGISFLYRGKMCVGVISDELCARYLEDRHPEIASQSHVRPMDFTGKNLKNFVYVHQDALQADEDIRKWIQLGMEHADNTK